LFCQAISLPLRSDVPIGVSLSGGLDSTSIAYYASKMHDNLKCFTFGSYDDFNSEGPIVADFASRLKLDTIYVTPNSDSINDALWKTIDAQDAPFGGPSIIAQNLLYEKASSYGIKVLLGGQGGDESFMGYNKFKFFYLKHLVNNSKFPEAFSLILSLLPSLYAEKGSLARLLKTSSRYTKNSGLKTNLSFDLISADNGLMDISEQGLKERQVKDILSNSLPTLLRFEDRNSMNHSIESRLPYMDYKLVEFGLNLPIQMKINNGFGKWINRVAFKNKIPDSINFARFKKGFNVDSYFYQNGFGGVLRNNLKEKWPIAKHYFKNKNLNIDLVFSDESLKNNFSGVGDIITALWLTSKNK
jgi:asparagine synthase (glutamine-hydrolysing)